MACLPSCLVSGTATKCLIKASCLLLLCGCDRPEEPWGAVTGCITTAGQPVEAALVLFSNQAQGVEYTGETDAEGRFQIRTDRFAGLPIGEYKVVVTPMPARGTPDNGMTFPSKPSKPKPTMIPIADQALDTTRLFAVVKEGNNDFRFELDQ